MRVRSISSSWVNVYAMGGKEVKQSL